MTIAPSIPPPRPRSALARGAAPYAPAADRPELLRLDLNEDLSGPLARVAWPTNVDLATYLPATALATDLAAALSLPEDRVWVTAGADEAIYGLLRAYLDPGDRLLLPWPTFGEFTKVGEGLGTAIERVPYGPDLAFPLAAYITALRRGPRVAVVVTPANPTGELIPPADVLALAALAPETLLLVDEAYAEYAGASVTRFGPLPANVAVIRTFSKAYGLAAARIGYVIADPQVLYAMRQVLPTFSPALPSILLARAGLRRPDRLAARVRAIQAGQRRIARWGAAHGMMVHQTAANFVLLRLGDTASATALASALAQRGVLVADRTSVLPGTLRVTVGAPRHVSAFLRALEGCV
ncbi:MAG TPA: histidinol-phosphate transaminase [Chloroflexota bacterium]|nr:histidinol-phosphate transaminase [Chloroflexota bacterium]